MVEKKQEITLIMVYHTHPLFYLNCFGAVGVSWSLQPRQGIHLGQVVSPNGLSMHVLDNYGDNLDIAFQHLNVKYILWAVPVDQ